MRCKKHPADLSSGVGVCASYLRHRLSALMEAQARLRRDCRKSDAHQPPPLSFPRSVSPLTSRQKKETGRNHRSLYSTPQIGPTTSLLVGIRKTKSNGGGRFSALVLGLFRSKSDKHDLDSVESCSAFHSWFSNMFPRRRKKQAQSFPIGAQRNRERGMSPARYSDEEGGSSGYSSDGWRQTPRSTPARRRMSRILSGLAFCLSPLVRAGPNRQWGVPAEALMGREPALFCKNRSRKLADFGRYNSRH